MKFAGEPFARNRTGRLDRIHIDAMRRTRIRRKNRRYRRRLIDGARSRTQGARKRDQR
jgi:hypothetical protein